MTYRSYKVNRQVHDQQSFFRDYPEYNGYRMYMVEAAGSSWNNPKNLCILTREMLMNGQSVAIDDDKELVPLRGQDQNIFVSGTRTLCYRPARMLSNTFTIKSMVLSPENPVETFGSRKVAHADYYCYEVEQTAYNGYRGTLGRLFTKALHFRGMEVPAEDLVLLPERKRNDMPHFMHDTSSRAYGDRLLKSLKA